MRAPRTLSAGLLGAALLATTGAPALADAGDFVGGVISGVILKTVIDEGVRGRPAPPPRRIVRDPAAAAYWRDVQHALNAAGFDAGPADGVPGPRTRAAVRGFQASIGAEPTGRLAPPEHAELMRAAGFAAPAAGPAVGGPVDAPDPAGAAPALAAGDLDDAALDALSAGTDVLGIGVGTAARDAEASFSASVGPCETVGALTTCAGRTDSYADEASFATFGAGGEATVYAVERTIRFTRPVDPAVLEPRLAEALGPVVADEDMLIGSGPACERTLDGTGLDAAAEAVRRHAEGGAAGPLVGVPPECRAYYAITMEGGGDGVEIVRVHLFDGRIVAPVAAAAGSAPVDVRF